jgi:hypothetical protein
VLLSMLITGRFGVVEDYGVFFVFHGQGML